jgi:hypothetical protein
MFVASDERADSNLQEGRFIQSLSRVSHPLSATRRTSSAEGSARHANERIGLWPWKPYIGDLSRAQGNFTPLGRPPTHDSKSPCQAMPWNGSCSGTPATKTSAPGPSYPIGPANPAPGNYHGAARPNRPRRLLPCPATGLPNTYDRSHSHAAVRARQAGLSLPIGLPILTGTEIWSCLGAGRITCWRWARRGRAPPTGAICDILGMSAGECAGHARLGGPASRPSL